jgi:serine/threonine protein kinase
MCTSSFGSFGGLPELNVDGQELIAVTPQGVPVIMDTAMDLYLGPSGLLNDGGVRWRAPEMLRPLDHEPEDAQDDAPATTQSDVYSFGMTLYEVRCELLFCVGVG